MWYPDEVIFRFKRLKYQLNRLKTSKWAEKYSKIEFYRSKYITFRRFCDEVEEFHWWFYRDEPTSKSIQEVFDNLSWW